MRALNLTNTHGGTWHGELSLAGLAQHLLTAPSSGHALSIAQPDPDRYLVDLPSPGGTLTVVRPPGSPTWTTGPETVDPTSVAWYRIPADLNDLGERTRCRERFIRPDAPMECQARGADRWALGVVAAL